MNKKIIVGIGGSLLLVLLVVLFIEYDAFIGCPALEKELNKLMDSMNYCEVDSDCVAVSGVGLYCWDLVNKNEDTSVASSLREEFYDKCEPARVKCAAEPSVQEIICKENRCYDSRRDIVLEDTLR